MKRISIYTIIAAATALVFNACQPKAYGPDDIFKTDAQAQAILDAEPNGYQLYTLHEFMDTYMTEEGNKYDMYRTRSKVVEGGNTYYLFSIDTLPVGGKGIYIRGRITTDDLGGNYYKSIIIQQMVDGKQQNLRLSVDIGSASGLYQLGQEIMIRCNGLAIGRYSNQVQLCIPTYDNKVNAINAEKKVGWAPGRIPSALFRKATTLIGLPNRSALHYDTIAISDFFTHRNLVEVRKMDAMLVTVANVHFTGQYEDNGSLKDCTKYDGKDATKGVPEVDGNANVFAPTTSNIGYPQSRVIEDNEGKHTLVSTSEYAKYASYLLPEPNYVGCVTGILGFYADNNEKATEEELDGYEWAITPRDIRRNEGCIDDIHLYNEKGEPWIPIEFVTNLDVE